MRIATYNVNGVNGRLANLLGWLEETAPSVVCLQELKAPDDGTRETLCSSPPAPNRFTSAFLVPIFRTSTICARSRTVGR